MKNDFTTAPLAPCLRGAGGGTVETLSPPHTQKFRHAQLSGNERTEFFRLIGRVIDDKYIPLVQARHAIKIERAAMVLAKRYTKRVWANRDLDEYLLSQASKCAQFASELAPDGFERTYYLHDAGGRPSHYMGHVHFRLNNFCPSMIDLEPTVENRRKFITIENIEIHPSIRHRGFLSRVMDGLKYNGFKAVALGSIANPSLAYHYYQKSLTSNNVVRLRNR